VATHRRADVPDDDEGDFAVADIAWEAQREAQRPACDPPYPRPDWLPGHWDCVDMVKTRPGVLLALIETNAPDAVRRARGNLERYETFTRTYYPNARSRRDR
jgi:hypothetical protein